MSDFNHMDHDAPVLQLVRNVLHRDTTLRDRVRKMRYRRRKPVETVTEDESANNSDTQSMNTTNDNREGEV